MVWMEDEKNRIEERKYIFLEGTHALLYIPQEKRRSIIEVYQGLK